MNFHWSFLFEVYWKFKLLGCGDFTINDITDLPDPCPLPEGLKKRTLIEKEKTIYAPMSGVGGIVYDKDAVYIDLGGSHSHSKSKKVTIKARPQIMQIFIDFSLIAHRALK